MIARFQVRSFKRMTDLLKKRQGLVNLTIKGSYSKHGNSALTWQISSGLPTKV